MSPQRFCWSASPAMERAESQSRVEDDGGQWLRLWTGLVVFLSRRGVLAEEAEDVASETVEKVLRRGCGPGARWAYRAARNLAVSRWRRATYLGIDGCTPLEQLPSRGEASQSRSVSVAFSFDRLRPTVGRPDQDTLSLLVAGVSDMAQIAKMRGVSQRAVWASLARLRAAAAAVGKYSLPVHVQASLSHSDRFRAFRSQFPQ